MDLNLFTKKRYMYGVRKQFPIYGTKTPPYIRRFEIYLEEYLYNHPHSTYTDLIKEFGTPEAFTSSYYELFHRQALQLLKKQKHHLDFLISLIFIMSFSMIFYFKRFFS